MKKIQRNILDWYCQHGRHHLPWRKTDDPYHIYLSEVMLQQTQVKTVLERYYFPFLERFPTLQALGKAKLDEVLKMWEGLGYYNRARNLHKTAALIDTLPDEINQLLTLPGIGKNTAHAIAAFAFRQPVPIMEANVKRILCRLHTFRNPKDKELWEQAYTLLDTVNPFDYNQAMMDIGATICLPKNPLCGECPLESICKGKEDPESYPARKIRTVPTKEQHIVIHHYNDRLAMYQRSGKFLHGLWGFESTEAPPCAAEYLGKVSHAYTHFKLNCRVYLYHESTPQKAHYFTPREFKKLAVSKIDEKIIKRYLDTIQPH